MHRDPRRVEDDDEGVRRISTRAWGLVLGLWAALFTFLALVVMPLFFTAFCEPR